ncbi:MAG TPA: hypothetical protein VK465_14035 [Fibrobacteria bacterium]|nr:hypothetical protein [Fibrobacteria bacterium]
MSVNKIRPPAGEWEHEPGGATLGTRRCGGIPSRGISLVAGLGLLALLPGAAVANDDSYSYGSAEITLGLPNASISVGRTWESAPPRKVIVERVTHKLPETDDFEEEEAEGYSEAEAYEEDEAEERVIIEKRRPRVAKKVTIIEKYEEPAHCEPTTVVRKVYVNPCPPTRVIVHRHAPRHVVYTPSRTVIVHEAPRSVHEPRNLFPDDGGRPNRSRGTRLVRVGGHSN